MSYYWFNSKWKCTWPVRWLLIWRCHFLLSVVISRQRWLATEVTVVVRVNGITNKFTLLHDVVCSRLYKQMYFCLIYSRITRINIIHMNSYCRLSVAIFQPFHDNQTPFLLNSINPAQTLFLWTWPNMSGIWYCCDNLPSGKDAVIYSINIRHWPVS